MTHKKPELEKFRGCLLGGAVGDALGAPVEFLDRQCIIKYYGGEPGIRDYLKIDDGVQAEITDDTQMTLFTAEGLLRTYVRYCTYGTGKLLGTLPEVITHAYLRWLFTQGETHPLLDVDKLDGWLVGHKELFARRAPGNTCLGALRNIRHFDDPHIAENNSKGCGGVMRVAPVGMFFAATHRFDNNDKEKHAFETGMQAAALTHGHPTGHLAAGAFALIVMLVLEGAGLREAAERTMARLPNYNGHEETLQAMKNVLNVSQRFPNDPNALKSLGEGWVAEEALTVALYAALSADESPKQSDIKNIDHVMEQQHRFEDGIVLSVNHDGDSDSTGAICGNLLGAKYGQAAIPQRWLEPLELREVIEEMADDLATFEAWNLDTACNSPESQFYINRYPGW
jgi:ADP-ribosylglycohydrolase